MSGNYDPIRPKMVSLFAGAGGLDVGLERAGFDTIFATDIEPYACETLRANRVLRALHPNEFDNWFNSQVAGQRCYKGSSLAELARLRRRLSSAVSERETYLEHAHIAQTDIRELTSQYILETTGKRKGDIDLIAGGPPCQPFSRAGKRELVESDDGQLFRDFVRLVDEIRPRFFLFENVKGLVQHKADVARLACRVCGIVSLADFECRDSLKDAETHRGQCRSCTRDVTFDVIWTKQKAGSLDIIAHEFERLGYRCDAQVLNAANFGAPQMRERLFISGSRDGEAFAWPQPTHSNPSEKLAPSLFDVLEPVRPWQSMNDVLYKSGHWRYGDLDPARAVLWVKNVVRPHDEPVTWSLNRPSPTIGAHQAAKLAIAPEGVPEEQLFRQQWHVLGRRQGDTRPVKVEHEYLTDEELLSLQTFPSSWYLFGTRMQRAFQIGNAVPPVLATAVGSALMAAMGHASTTRLDAKAGDASYYATSI